MPVLSMPLCYLNYMYYEYTYIVMSELEEAVHTNLKQADC